MLKWWVEASYAAHDNMQGHTGGTMAMRKDRHGSIISISETKKSKHKDLDGGRTHRGGQRNDTDSMDKVLPGGTRV